VNTGGAGRATEIPGFPEVAGFLDFELAGAIIQATMIAGVGGGIALAMDVEQGFFDRLVASPISRYSMIVGRLAATGVIGVLVAIWFMIGGIIFGAEIHAGLPGALLIVVLTAFTASAFGGLGAALALRTGRTSVVQGIFPLVFVIIFLSSAFFPRHLLQEPAQTIADFNPMSFIAEAIRDPVISDISWDAMAKGLGGVAVLAAIAWSLTALALRYRLRTG
jgi:ABC-2 type transport system permease protein